MPRTLGMIKTSDYGAALSESMFVPKIVCFTLLCFVCSVAHAFDGVKLIYLKPCETCVMLGATFLAILA